MSNERGKHREDCRSHRSQSEHRVASKSERSREEKCSTQDESRLSRNVTNDAKEGRPKEVLSKEAARERLKQSIQAQIAKAKLSESVSREVPVSRVVQVVKERSKRPQEESVSSMPSVKRLHKEQDCEPRDIEQQMRRAEEITNINNSSFQPQTFYSSRSYKRIALEDIPVPDSPE